MVRKLKNYVVKNIVKTNGCSAPRAHFTGSGWNDNDRSL